MSYNRKIIDAHRQIFPMSCVPSAVEMVLKLLDKAERYYYDLQCETKNKGSDFARFDGVTIKGVEFKRVTQKNMDLSSFQSFFSTIDDELAAGRKVMVSLKSRTKQQFHIHVIHEKRNDDYLAFTKVHEPDETKDYSGSVKDHMKSMDIADILIYRITNPNYFKGPNDKLERAEYFFGNLQVLADEAGGLAHVPREKQQELRATLDGFFFELISAKDFFLQAINEAYGLGLPRDEATQINNLKQCLSCKNCTCALSVVKTIEKNLSDSSSPIWKINNYRNSATHRELLHFAHEASTDYDRVMTFLFEDPEDPQKGNAPLEVIPYCKSCLQTMREFLEELYSKLNI